MPYGWVGAILDVDLTSGKVATRDTLPYVRAYLGGRALALRLAWDGIPAGADAYAPENRVVIATGPLTGTLAPTSGRTVMSSLSPRVYPRPWHTHSTLGGWFGPALKCAGYDALVIHGKASAPVYLEVSDQRVRLVEAGDLWGLGAMETQRRLKARLGPDTQVLAIGPAGERRVRFATVQHAEENAAGHSGFGGVWGSKHLKAVVVRGTGSVAVADPSGLIREVQELGTFRPTPCTLGLAGQERVRERKPICSQACIFNCSLGRYGQTEDGQETQQYCIGGVWGSESGMRLTRYSGGGVEVPPGRNFGLRREGDLHRLCNDLGLDLWFRLVMQPWLIRCKQLGVHAIRGYRIEPEDGAWFEGFMRALAHREGLGDLLAEDLPRAMDELAGELPDELVLLGRELEFGFGFPAHREGRFWDEEPLPFWVISAMMYASESRDPTIGTHQSSLLLADFALADPELARRRFRSLSQKAWGYADALDPTFERKAPVALWCQHQHVIIDTLPLCDFAFPQLVRPLAGLDAWRAIEDLIGDLDFDRRLLEAVTGEALGREDLNQIAERAFTIERALLARAGRTRRMEEALAPHFRLPCRADGTLVEEPGFSALLDEYYAARGWDRDLGWPTPDLLERLGLGEIEPELEQRRRDLARAQPQS